MGKRVAFLSVSALVLLLAAVIALQPYFASAASIGDTMIKRLCDRQAALGSRLSSPLIDPSLCAATPTPAPTLSFTANPTTVAQGAQSALSWNSTNATSCSASNGWSGAKSLSGTQNVFPNATTTYQLDCTGSGGTVSKTVTVNVVLPSPDAPTLTLTASRATVNEGSVSSATSTLTWDSTNATACAASNGWSGSKSVDGNEIVQPTATTSITYILTCTGPGGSITQSVTLTVASPLAPLLTFSANPTTVHEGSISDATTTLTWDSTNATSCVASNASGWTGAKAIDGSAVIAPTATSVYQLDCTGPGGTIQATTTVTFVPVPVAPTLTLVASPTSIQEGSAGNATSTLTWTSTNTTSCTASNGWTGSKALNETEIVQPTGTTSITYVLTCSGAGGDITKEVTLAVTPPVLQTIGHLVISEVHYDVASTTAGSESSNEWIELFNGSNFVINLQGWSVGDASSTDSVSASILIQPGQYAVIAASTTPSGIPAGVPVIVLHSSIGNNGFTNDGDGARLLDPSDALVDAIGYGDNVTVSPNVSIPGSTDGHSIKRVQLTSDTDTAADWADTSSPSPGQ